jgi:hypothetical protein
MQQIIVDYVGWVSIAVKAAASSIAFITVPGRPLVGLCRDCHPTPYHAFRHAGYALDSK